MGNIKRKGQFARVIYSDTRERYAVLIDTENNDKYYRYEFNSDNSLLPSFGEEIELSKLKNLTSNF